MVKNTRHPCFLKKKRMANKVCNNAFLVWETSFALNVSGEDVKLE